MRAWKRSSCSHIPFASIEHVESKFLFVFSSSFLTRVVLKSGLILCCSSVFETLACAKYNLIGGVAFWLGDFRALKLFHHEDASLTSTNCGQSKFHVSRYDLTFLVASF